MHRRRDARRLAGRAVLEVGAASALLRKTNVFTEALDVDELRSAGAALPLEDFAERLTSGRLGVDWRRASQRWRSAWQDLNEARRRFAGDVGAYDGLLGPGEKRRLQELLSSLDESLEMIARLDETWTELASHELFGARDERAEWLRAETESLQRQLGALVSAVISRCRKFERDAEPYRVLVDPAAEAARSGPNEKRRSGSCVDAPTRSSKKRCRIGTSNIRRSATAIRSTFLSSLRRQPSISRVSPTRSTAGITSPPRSSVLASASRIS